MKTTYNKSQILKKAWSLVKTKGYTLRNAMRGSWAYARNVIAGSKRSFVYKGDAEKIFTSPVSKHVGFAALQVSLNRGMAL